MNPRFPGGGIPLPESTKWKPYASSLYPSIWNELTGVLIRSIRAVSHAAIGFFIQEVSIFTGQALVTVAPKAGLTVRGTLSASLLVSVVVARGAGGDTDPTLWNGKKRGQGHQRHSLKIFFESMIVPQHPKGPILLVTAFSCVGARAAEHLHNIM